jgi:hypothetical protein
MKRLVTARLASLLIAVLSVACLTVTPAQAARACGLEGNYFNSYGGSRPEWRYEGVSSYIVVRDTFLCTGVTGIENFGNAWVMIAGSGQNEWGQVGFERTSGVTLRWFSQFNDGEHNLDTRYSSFNIISERGVRHTFRVLWSPSCPGDRACLRAVIDSTNWDYSAWNPYVEWGPMPWDPFYAGETGHLASDIPGNGTDRTVFSSMGVQRYEDDILESLPCGLTEFRNDNSARWGRASSSCTSVSVWTYVR